MKRALITGVTGQDGSYLADFLLERDYEVFGLVRRTSKPNTENITHLMGNPRFHVLYGDLTDQGSINRAILEATPDEVYNLAAQSFVGGSWDYPVSTGDITGLGPLRLLEALRQFNPKARYYQASSSEMFGNQGGLLNEESVLAPRSPYGSAKAFAHYTTVNYRESYGMHASCGILFNHESPRRGIEFVTRKITDGVAKIKLGQQKTLKLGNIEAKRDWGDARDYVYAMWLMLQQDEPDNYVIATGHTHSIKVLLDLAFRYASMEWEKHVEIDKSFFRPAEINVLIGDSTKARDKLGWEPQITFQQMVRDMLDADLERHKHD
jgi:GDPmannose 4,6-dehydratase